MSRLLNPTIHGVADYVLVAAFLLLPTLLDFSQSAATLSYISGVLYLGASLLTKYPLGALKLFPFPIHGIVEAILAAVWIIVPWLYGFADDTAARNFFVIAGVALLIVVALTSYRATGARGAFSGEERRHRITDRRARAMAVMRDRRVGRRDRRSYAAT